MKLRPCETTDLPHLARLFHDTIHAVNLGDYTPEQVEAWAPEKIDLDRWRSKLDAQKVIVAEWQDAIVGFCSWDDTGYLDLLYVHHAFQRKGIASALYHSAEKSMYAAKIKRVETQASITAQPFFLRKDFRIVKRQFVNIRGVDLPNAVMEKALG